MQKVCQFLILQFSCICYKAGTQIEKKNVLGIFIIFMNISPFVIALNFWYSIYNFDERITSPGPFLLWLGGCFVKNFKNYLMMKDHIS